MVRRAQLAAGETIIAIGVFLVMVAGVLVFLRMHTAGVREEITYRDIEAKATLFTDALVGSGGAPWDWERDPATATLPGLADHGRVLSPTKVAAFMAMGHAQVRSLCNLGGYDYAISLARVDSTPIAWTGVVTGKRVVGVRRTVVYNGTAAFLSVRVHG